MITIPNVYVSTNVICMFIKLMEFAKIYLDSFIRFS